MKKFIISTTVFLSSFIFASAHASSYLAPGHTVAVPAATASGEIDLAGGVLVDNVIPFKIVSGTGVLLYKGSLQNRIVRSTSTGLLHFYYRIRDTQAGLPGKILALTTQNFASVPRLTTSYRPDGLGNVVPVTASRSLAGSQVQFRFARIGAGVLGAGQDSKFFELKTTAKNYNDQGLTRITLSTGQSAVVHTLQPVVP